MATAGLRGTGAAIGNILKWSRRPEWAPLFEEVLDEHLGEVLDEFELESTDVLAEKIGTLAYQTSIFGAAFEDFLTRGNEEGESIVDEYLRRRAYKETVPGRRYLEAIGDSVMSLYEVLDVAPGSHLVLRDLVRGGEPARVEERSGSRQALKWDIVAARVVTHNQQQMLTGVVLLFETAEAQALIGALREAAREMQTALEKGIADVVTTPVDEEGEATTEEAAFERALRSIVRGQVGSGDPAVVRRFVEDKLAKTTIDLILRRSAPIFTQIWLRQTLGRLLAPPPELRNFDGEPILHAETRWPIAAGVGAAVAQRLDGAASRRIRRSDPDEQTWTWEGDKSLSRGPRAGTLGPDTAAAAEPLDLVSLGSIAIEEDALVLRTNSEGRAARGRALLETLLAGLLGTAAVSHRDMVAEAWAQHGEGAGDEPSERETAPDIPVDVKARLLSEFKDRHYRAWLDMAMPRLGGKTPRQAAHSTADRDALVRLLKDLENNELRLARDERMPAYDAGWIWRELGLRSDAA
jgi:hypothetical protein